MTGSNNVPQVTQLMSCGAETRAQVCLVPAAEIQVSALLPVSLCPSICNDMFEVFLLYPSPGLTRCLAHSTNIQEIFVVIFAKEQTFLASSPRLFSSQKNSGVVVATHMAPGLWGSFPRLVNVTCSQWSRPWAWTGNTQGAQSGGGRWHCGPPRSAGRLVGGKH